MNVKRASGFIGHWTVSAGHTEVLREVQQRCVCNSRMRMTTRSTPSKRTPGRRAFLQRVASSVPLAVLLPALAEGARSSATTESGNVTKEDGTKIQDIDPGTDEPEITDRVYLDFTLDGGAPERVTIGLYGNIVPSTVANFKSLVQSGYVGTSVYRVVPGLTVQLGDVLNNGGKSGRAATEDGTLELENVRVKHSIPGLVSMANGRDGRVDSRFFITTRPGDSGYLDGRYCAFGRVMDNMEFWYRVERAAGKNAFGSRLPKVRIIGAGMSPAS